ncbi:MAG: hypothetical protein IJ350_07705 [Clostridia bacterium]|nr:hypothetical protein [Clostridia bacterium]
MKKNMVALLLCIVLMALSVCAVAEAPLDLTDVPLEQIIFVRDYLNQEIASRLVQQNSSLQPKSSFEGEIKFRDIEWGASATEVRNKLAAQGVISSEHDIKSVDSIQAWSVSCDPVIEWEAGATISVYDFADTFRVAGYPLSAMWIDCPYSYQTDKVDRSMDGTQLMYAEMKFNVTDIELVYEDLTNKLISLYGQPEEVTDNNGYTSLADMTDWTEYNTWRVWYGADNTGVYLYKTYRRAAGSDTVEMPELILAYGKTDGAAYLAGIKTAIQNEEKAYDAMVQQQNVNNVDGL